MAGDLSTYTLINTQCFQKGLSTRGRFKSCSAFVSLIGLCDHYSTHCLLGHASNKVLFHFPTEDSKSERWGKRHLLISMCSWPGLRLKRRQQTYVWPHKRPEKNWLSNAEGQTNPLIRGQRKKKVQSTNTASLRKKRG